MVCKLSNWKVTTSFPVSITRKYADYSTIIYTNISVCLFCLPVKLFNPPPTQHLSSFLRNKRKVRKRIFVGMGWKVKNDNEKEEWIVQCTPPPFSTQKGTPPPYPFLPHLLNYLENYETYEPHRKVCLLIKPNMRRNYRLRKQQISLNPL